MQISQEQKMVETSYKKCKNKEELYPTATYTHTPSQVRHDWKACKAWVILMKLSQSYFYRNFKAKFALMGYNVVRCYIPTLCGESAPIILTKLHTEESTVSQ